MNTITKATVNQRQVWRVYYHENNGISKDFQSEDEAKFYAGFPYFETEKYNSQKAYKMWLFGRVIIKAPVFDAKLWKFNHKQYGFYLLVLNIDGNVVGILPYSDWNFKQMDSLELRPVSTQFLSRYCRLVTIYPPENL